MATNNLEWLNNNMHRNYPLNDDCSALSTAGTYLPSTLLVDMNISIYSTKDTNIESRLFLSSLIVTGGYVKLIVSYKTNSSSFECLISEDIPIDIETSWEITDKLFRLTPAADIPEQYADILALTKATVVIGSCADIAMIGGMEFSYEDAMLSPMVVNVISSPYEYEHGIDSIDLLNSSGVTIGKLESSFILQAGAGVDILVDDSGDMPIVTVVRKEFDDSSYNDPLSVEDIVEAVYKDLGNPIRSINGVIPDEHGNISIIGKTCTNIEEGTAYLSISNSCSQPCCQKTDSDIAEAVDTLSSYASRLVQYFESMSTVISSLQSRLSALIAYRK